MQREMTDFPLLEISRPIYAQEASVFTETEKRMRYVIAYAGEDRRDAMRRFLEAHTPAALGEALNEIAWIRSDQSRISCELVVRAINDTIHSQRFISFMPKTLGYNSANQSRTISIVRRSLCRHIAQHILEWIERTQRESKNADNLHRSDRGPDM